MMEKTTILRALMVFGFSIFALGLPGCSSIFGKKPAADTPAAAEQTAFLMCDGCHGPEQVRVEFMSPKIIGQKKAYLAAKLRDFRDHKRINPYMNGVMAKMTDQDIANLAAYYADDGHGIK